MLSILYILLGLVGLIVIRSYGQRHAEASTSRHLSGLVAVLLIVGPVVRGVEMWIWDYPIGIIPFALPLIGILFITERHNLSDYYLTKENFWISLLYGAIVTCVVIIPFSIYIVCSRIGQISWLSNQQMAQIGLSPMSIALAEELTYRSVFLRYLREQSFAPITANVIQSIYFCFVHIRYIEGRDYLFVGFTLAVGLLAGWITLKQKNIAGALLIHVTGNLIPLLINNGQMPFL